MSRYILVLDQGTTSSRATVYNEKGEKIAISQKEFKQHYPKPGWFEHNPDEIWNSVISTAQDVLVKAGLEGKDIAALGITNQRETTTIWEKDTGKPLYNSIVWGCRRGTEICKGLIDAGYSETFNEKTGLVIDPTYSASKIRWVLDNVEGANEGANNGELLFGTVDTWLLWNLTKGKVHATDYSNASRTMVFNVKEGKWDDELLGYVDIPKNILPEVKPSIGLFGYTDPSWFGAEIPITGIAGDQHAALFGQACFEEGDAKNTYGTSNVPMMYIGNTPIKSEKGLLSLAWQKDGEISYCMGASILTTGSAVQWLRDGIKIVKSSAETETLANSVEDTQGVYFVPAFQGLAAPHWDMYARGMMIGLTAGVTEAHIARATLESIAYQTRDLMEEIEKESGKKLRVLKVDGGATVNEYLMQFQADILDCIVERPADIETTSLGAAYMAGLGVGIWKSTEELKEIWKCDKRYYPNMEPEKREELYNGWKRAVSFAKGWLDPAK